MILKNILNPVKKLHRKIKSSRFKYVYYALIFLFIINLIPALGLTYLYVEGKREEEKIKNIRAKYPVSVHQDCYFPEVLWTFFPLQADWLYENTLIFHMRIVSIGFRGLKINEHDLLILKKFNYLKELDFENSQIEDVSFLKGLKLSQLDLSGTQIKTIDSLKGMPLKELKIDRTKIKDLSPVKGAPLEILHLNQSAVSDLSSLKDLPLKALELDYTSVKNLNPLKGLKLSDLSLEGTLVEDLTPLQGMPLTWLDIDNTPVKDLTPLRGMKTLESKYSSNSLALVFVEGQAR